MAMGGVGEAMLVGAITGAGTSAITGNDPLKGALLGAAGGGVGAGVGGALGGQAATQAGTAATTQAGTAATTQAGTAAGLELLSAASPAVLQAKRLVRAHQRLASGRFATPPHILSPNDLAYPTGLRGHLQLLAQTPEARTLDSKTAEVRLLHVFQPGTVDVPPRKPNFQPSLEIILSKIPCKLG
jgi:hypothetical protein